MMKKIAILFICNIVLLTNCNKIPTCENCNFTCIDKNETNVFTNNCKSNWDCNFKTLSNSVVNTNEFQGYSNGNKLVFQMYNSTEGSPLIADDEFTNIMVFEIDENIESFSIENNEIEKIKLHYRNYCFCADVDFKPIETGCIQGEKQTDGTWFIQGNITVNYTWGNEDVRFEASFK